ncbi:hypothetical protein AB6A40_005684 [Gnathostoma spinigerum]|uniref:Uncharacterized protein n=1 Tax=Gnathostoma spinigerum TaxID=75299 RepID=A0ABD6ERT7_9BILA
MPMTNVPFAYDYSQQSGTKETPSMRNWVMPWGCYGQCPQPMSHPSYSSFPQYSSSWAYGPYYYYETTSSPTTTTKAPSTTSTKLPNFYGVCINGRCKRGICVRGECRG